VRLPRFLSNTVFKNKGDQTTRTTRPSKKSAANSNHFVVWLGGGVLLLALLIGGAVGGYALYLNMTKEVPASKGTLTEGRVGQPRRVNPLYAPQSSIDRDLSELIYPSLFSYTTDGELKGELVKNTPEASQVTDNGQTYTFTLKNNVSWEDGTPITPEDIIFTVRTIQDPNVESPLRKRLQDVNITKTGEREVEFRLPASYSPFKSRLTFGILPRHVWGEIDRAKFKTTSQNLKPVGGGPFSLQSVGEEDERISRYTLTRNDRYFGKKPFLETLTFRFYTNQSSLVSAFQNEEIDTMLAGTFQDTLSGSTRHSLSTTQYFGLFFNTQTDLLEEDVIRQALRLSFDKENLVSQHFGARGRVLNSALTPANRFSITQDDSFDIDQAKRLLDEAGWKDTQGGDGIREKGDTRASFTITYSKDEDAKAFLKALAQKARDVGIDITLNEVTFSTLRSDYVQSQEYDYDALYAGQVLEKYPDPYIYWHSSQIAETGLNLSQYKAIETDKFLESARTNTDQQVIKNSLAQFQRKLHDDIPAIFSHSRNILYYTRDRVRGVEISRGGDASARFKTIAEWYTQTKRVGK